MTPLTTEIQMKHNSKSCNSQWNWKKADIFHVSSIHRAHRLLIVRMAKIVHTRQVSPVKTLQSQSLPFYHCDTPTTFISHWCNLWLKANTSQSHSAFSLMTLWVTFSTTFRWHKPNINSQRIYRWDKVFQITPKNNPQKQPKNHNAACS